MHLKSILVPLLCGVLYAQNDGKATVGTNNEPGGPGPLSANLNMTLIKHWHRASGVQYNDIWGWTSPEGREFAYVGETAGIWFVETTDPSNIKQVGWWSSPQSTWRDYANVGPYVYSVSEGHRGIRIIDMQNPDQPKDLGYVEQSAIKNTHNITADPDTGYLYLSGTNQGLMIYDASQNPTAPKLVSTWYPSRTYTHDCCVVKGRAYLSTGYSYAARIMNCSNPASMVEIGRCNTPGGYDHNVWVSEDAQLLCVTDEIARGSSSPHLTVWDISQPQTPNKLGDYDLNTIVHNVFILGRTAYMSHYVDGVHIVDLADPTNPTMVANYDTSTVGSGYAGCWGIHVFTDHGLVYASDMQNGLYVFQVDCGHLNRFGNGTKGTKGMVPRLRFDGATPRVGAKKLRMEIENLVPSAQCALLVSPAKGSTSLLGVNLHVDMQNLVILRFKADANGQASLPIAVPPDPNLGNVRVYMQVVADDLGAKGGYSASRGMWVGICK
jgi:choice-of-anchor B domain-containing protein